MLEDDPNTARGARSCLLFWCVALALAFLLILVINIVQALLIAAGWF